MYPFQRIEFALRFEQPLRECERLLGTGGVFEYPCSNFELNFRHFI